MKEKVSAIIVAAGNASRMGGVNKQILKINGLSVLMYSILAFEQVELVDEIIVVTKKETLSGMKSELAQYTFTKPVLFTEGGDTRQKSVAKGIMLCSPDTEYVAIHDGARPLIQPDAIVRVIQDAIQYGAAALGVASKDTVKIVEENGFIVSTPERSRVYQIQTPQVFQKALYLKGMEYARSVSDCYTDDCQLAEAIGERVYVTQGSYRNIKITTPEDVLLVQTMLSQKEQEGEN
jgi:2-C-methyl-D-erythritol 4-phosphate cytidylyltransferase